MRNCLLLFAVFIAVSLAPKSTLLAQLSGAYTINASAAASATNYQNFASAVNDMVSGTRTDGGTANGPAVSGPVTFTVAAGTYNERVSINAITGTSATNTVTFDGVDNATRTISWSGTGSTDYALRLNGADFLTFSDLTITNSNATTGKGVLIQNQSNSNTFDHCIINVSQTATSSASIAVVGGSSATNYSLHGTNLSFLNCDIVGGYYGLAYSGPSGTQSAGLTIDSCHFSQSRYMSIRLNYIDQAVISNSTIQMRNNITSGYGTYLYYCSRFNIHHNTFNQLGSYGLYMFQSNFNTNDQAFVTNNFVGGGFQGTGTSYGIGMSTGREVKIYHNSVLVDNPGSDARAFYLTGANSVGIDVRNNSFATDISGTGYASYVVNSTYIQTLDYNNYYTGNTNLLYMSGNHTTLASMQASFPQFDANSQSGWPNYTSSTDLHTFGAVLSNWATNIATVTTDIDYETRPLPPDLVKDVGADEFVLPAFDVDMVSIVSPTVASVGVNPVSFTIQTNGINSVNGQNITMQYSTDGGTTWPVTEVFVPSTMGSPGDQETFTFTVPWTVVTAGTFNFCIRINPQVTGDPDTSDQLCQSVCTGMGGTYTINSAIATGGTNFNSFTDAAAQLSNCGINGPVVFDIAPGTYNEMFTIDEIPGASATNTVLFDGGTTAACTLTQSINTINTALVRLNGADYVTFKHITTDIPSIYGYAFWFQNEADYNTIDSCDILNSLTTTSAYSIGVLFSGNSYSTYANTGNYNTVSNCLIQGGYYGVRCNGVNTTTNVLGNSFLNNTIREFRYTGIYTYYSGALTIEDNLITGRLNGGLTSGYGIYSYYANGANSIRSNTIYNVGARGITSGYYNRYGPGGSIIANNMIGGGFYTTGTAYGLYVFGGINMKIYNNSVNLGSNSGYAYYHSGSTTYTDSLYVVNNMFATGPLYGNGQAMFFSSGIVAALDVMDYNLFYTNGSNLANFNGNTYSSIAQLQAASFFFNGNSVEDNPGYIGDTDLHIICSTVDNLGTPLPEITDDIDKEARNAVNPDIGADEFTGQSITYDIGADTAVCEQLILYADTNAYVGFLWGGGQSTPQILIDSTNTYSVTVTDSNNCRATDSLVVTINENPSYPFNNDTINQCSYDTLNALNPGSTYNWSTNEVTQTIVPPTSGTYLVDITSPDGCTISDAITVGLWADAVAQLGPDTTFCLGAGATLNAGNGPNGTTYSWSSGATSQVILVSAPGTYTVTVTTPQGCIASDEIVMNALLAPVVELGQNRTECDQFTLDAGTGGATYIWSTNATTQTISSTSPGTYTVTVTNSDGCQSVDSVSIALGTTPPVNLGPNQILCANDVVILDAGYPGFDHLWSDASTNQTLTVNSAGTYLVQVTDPQTGCTGLDSVSISQSFVSVDLGPDFALCDGFTAMLDAGTTPSGYLWGDGSTSQTYNVTQPGTYTVQVTDAGGCIDEDTIVVTGRGLPVANFTSPASVPMLQSIAFTDQSGASVTSWSWDFGDGQTSTQQNPTHSYQAIGTFNVCLTVNDGFCSATRCQSVQVGNPVGIADEIFVNSVDVYPNPNNGSFSIGFDLPKALDLNIELYSITGQRMYANQINAVRMQTEDVNLEGQAAAGMYFLKITSDKGNEMIKKIIIE